MKTQLASCHIDSTIPFCCGEYGAVILICILKVLHIAERPLMLSPVLLYNKYLGINLVAIRPVTRTLIFVAKLHSLCNKVDTISSTVLVND